MTDMDELREEVRRTILRACLTESTITDKADEIILAVLDGIRDMKPPVLERNLNHEMGALKTAQIDPEIWWCSIDAIKSKIERTK